MGSDVTTGAGSTNLHFAGVVAMDGPSGTGKSTVARRLASRIGARYLDTGAMYRAATLAVLRSGVDPGDSAAVAAQVAGADIVTSTQPGNVGTWLDGERVDEWIRRPEVTAAVSAVSAIAAIRTQLVTAQRLLIGAGGIVVEGRDIGTVVWPAANPKIYLTADADIRAQRRAGELGTDRIADVAIAIARRDGFDSSRVASPLVRAADAIEVDTSHLAIDEVVQRLVDMTVAVMAKS